MKKGEKMEKKLKVLEKNCPKKHKCTAVKICPVGAITQKDFDVPKIDQKKCIKCGKCTLVCPKKVFVMEKDF